jgi:hypothetical protein
MEKAENNVRENMLSHERRIPGRGRTLVSDKTAELLKKRLLETEPLLAEEEITVLEKWVEWRKNTDQELTVRMIAGELGKTPFEIAKTIDTINQKIGRFFIEQSEKDLAFARVRKIHPRVA